EPDYMVDKLAPHVRQDIRNVPYEPVTEGPSRGYDAVVAIGQHAGARSRGYLAHTFFTHTRWVMGGVEMNEVMALALSAARFDMPVILVTGDDVLKDEVAAFSPRTMYVTVKHAVNTIKAEPRERGTVSREIEFSATE